MKVTRAVSLGVGAMLLAGCSSINTNSDQVGLHYSAGSLSDTTFDECVPRNKHNFDGPGDLHYVYPAGTRTYKFKDHAQGAEQGAITIVSKDNVRMTVEGILNFSLNTDCDVLKEFHERIGLKYDASGDGVGRWTELLQDYLGVALESSMKANGRDYTWGDLYYDEGKRQSWIDDVLEDLPGEVKEVARGDFFDPKAYTMLVPQPQPPEDLLDQLQQQQVQAERINTIDAQKAAQAAEIQQIRDLVAIFGPDGYILYRNQLQCEQHSDSCIPFLPVPQGANINVTPGG